jgi:hypothetical protein
LEYWFADRNFAKVIVFLFHVWLLGQVGFSQQRLWRLSGVES